MAILTIERPSLKPIVPTVPAFVQELWLPEVAAAKALLLDNLSRRQLQEIELASWGFTSYETADEDRRVHSTIRSWRREAVHNLGAHSMVQAVNRAALAGILEIQQDTRAAIALTELELTDLVLRALGFTAKEELALQPGVTRSALKITRDTVLEKFGTNRIAYAVRRAHAGGILPLID